MTNFKKGDVVRALDNSIVWPKDKQPAFIKGQTYTVKRYCSPSVLVEMDSHGSRTNGWGEKFFELVTPKTKPAKSSVLGTQVGGSHYTDCKIQPITYIWANNLGFSEGNVVKYITRWRSKGGIKDLEKAKHHIALLIEHELAQEKTNGL